MIEKSFLYKGPVLEDAESACMSIIELCKVGLAADSTTMNVDLTDGGYSALFEMIAALANDAVDRLENERPSSVAKTA